MVVLAPVTICRPTLGAVEEVQEQEEGTGKSRNVFQQQITFPSYWLTFASEGSQPYHRSLGMKEVFPNHFMSETLNLRYVLRLTLRST